MMDIIYVNLFIQYGEVETPAMDPDNSYGEEAPVSMASWSADDENDSNPSGRSSSESAFLKTRGRCFENRSMECKNFIPTWQIQKPNTGNAKYENGYPGNSRNTLDRRRAHYTRKPHNDILG